MGDEEKEEDNMLLATGGACRTMGARVIGVYGEMLRRQIDMMTLSGKGACVSYQSEQVVSLLHSNKVKDLQAQKSSNLISTKLTKP